MEEDGRLSDLRLLKFLVCASEHYCRNVEAQYRVGQVEVLLGDGVFLVEVFAHADKL